MFVMTDSLCLCFVIIVCYPVRVIMLVQLACKDLRICFLVVFTAANEPM